MRFLFPGNTAADLGAAIGVALAVAALLWAMHCFLISRLERVAARTATQADDWLLAVVRRTYKLSILIVALYAGSMVLELTPRYEAVKKLPDCVKLGLISIVLSEHDFEPPSSLS